LENEFLEERSFWTNEELDLLYKALAKHGRHFLHELTKEMEKSNEPIKKSMVEIESFLKALEKLKQFCSIETLDDSIEEQEPNQIVEIEKLDYFIDKEAIEIEPEKLRTERRIAVENLKEENKGIMNEMISIRMARKTMSEEEKLIEREDESQEILNKKNVNLYLRNKQCQLHPTTFEMISHCLEIFLRELIERADIYRMERAQNLTTENTTQETIEILEQMDSDDVLMALHDLDRSSPFNKNNVHLRKL